MFIPGLKKGNPKKKNIFFNANTGYYYAVIVLKPGSETIAERTGFIERTGQERTNGR